MPTAGQQAHTHVTYLGQSRAEQNSAPPVILAERRTLRKAGFNTLWDVLQHYPRDYSQVAPYPWTEPSQLVGVKGTVVRQAVRHRNTLLVEVTLENVQLDDGTPLPQGGFVRYHLSPPTTVQSMSSLACRAWQSAECIPRWWSLLLYS